MTYRSACLIVASILSALSILPILLHLWIGLRWGPMAMTAMSFASATTVAIPLVILRDSLRSLPYARPCSCRGFSVIVA